jgi:hypothetical protein
MSGVKVFKKGEYLFKEGEKVSNVFLIQSGKVSLHLFRQKQQIELCMVLAGNIAGEHALSGALIHPHSAYCVQETKAIELPVDAVKAQLEPVSQLVKFLTKGMSDKIKVMLKELTAARLEKDNTPCPNDQTAKIFGALFHVVRSKGTTKTEGVLTASWPLCKSYAQRVFLESPKRLEQAANIFVKLGVAKYEWVKNEDDDKAPEEIGYIHFTDLSLVEQFFEFYQYYYFKGGKMDFLKTDERVMQITTTLLEAGKGKELDRKGAVNLDYTELLETFKKSMSLQLNNDHFTLLESKGLFIKRVSTDKGIFLQFDYREFDNTYKVWKVLREVEKWNEKGSVDPNEVWSDGRKAHVAGPECPQCKAPYVDQPKFCSECGFKLVHAEAA